MIRSTGFELIKQNARNLVNFNYAPNYTAGLIFYCSGGN